MRVRYLGDKVQENKVESRYLRLTNFEVALNWLDRLRAVCGGKVFITTGISAREDRFPPIVLGIGWKFQAVDFLKRATMLIGNWAQASERRGNED